MFYFYYCRDENKDNQYHIKQCVIIKEAFKKDPPEPYYIHTTKDNVLKLGRMACPICKPDDKKHYGDVIKQFKP